MADCADRERLRTTLVSVGFDAVAFPDLTQLMRGWRRAESRLMLVDIDGLCDDWKLVMNQLRQQLPGLSVIVGTGETPKSASVALDAGADEFVSRPWIAAELSARVHAALRRADGPHRQSMTLTCGCCRLDVAGRKLVTARRSVELTGRETALARMMFQSMGGVVSRRALASIWEMEEDLASRSIEQHIYQLRRKIRLCAGGDITLRNVYARGYQLESMAAVPGAAKSSVSA